MVQATRQPVAAFGNGVIASPGGSQISRDERAKEPGMNRTLMLRAIACDDISSVSPLIPGIAPRQRSQSQWCQKFLDDCLQNRRMALRLQHRKRQADCQQLIWANGGIC